MSELDYEKRIVDYRASTDVAAVRWRDEVLRLDEKAQKKAFFCFAVTDARMAEAVHSIVGLATDGWPIVMQGNHVVHIERRHGVNGAQDHSMSDPNDFGRIAFALLNSTRLRAFRTIQVIGQKTTTRQHSLSFGRESTARLSSRPSFQIRASAGFSLLRRVLRKQNADEHL